MRKGFFFISFFLALSSFSWGASYYVDGTSGSDLNDCLSEVNACKTFDNLNGVFASGDTLYLKRGTTIDVSLYGAGGLSFTSDSAATSTITAYGTGDNPILKAGIDTGVVSWTDEGSNRWSFPSAAKNVYEVRAYDLEVYGFPCAASAWTVEVSSLAEVTGTGEFFVDTVSGKIAVFSAVGEPYGYVLVIEAGLNIPCGATCGAVVIDSVDFDLGLYYFGTSPNLSSFSLSNSNFSSNVVIFVVLTEDSNISDVVISDWGEIGVIR